MTSINDHFDNSIGLSLDQIELALLQETVHIFNQPLTQDTYSPSDIDLKVDIFSDKDFHDTSVIEKKVNADCPQNFFYETEAIDRNGSSTASNGVLSDEIYHNQPLSNSNLDTKEREKRGPPKIDAVLEWNNLSNAEKVPFENLVKENRELHRKEVRFAMGKTKKKSNKNETCVEFDQFVPIVSSSAANYDLNTSRMKYNLSKSHTASEKNFESKFHYAIPSINNFSKNLLESNGNLGINYDNLFQCNDDYIQPTCSLKERNNYPYNIREKPFYPRAIDRHAKNAVTIKGAEISLNESMSCKKRKEDVADTEENIKSLKKRRGRPKRDPLEGWPKRPLSAYNIFFKQERQTLLKSRASNVSDVILEKTSQENAKKKKKRPKKHGIISFIDLTREIALKWKELTEEAKTPYKIQAKNYMISYKEEMKEFLSHRQNARK